jgi:hypothetical protein
MAEAFATFGIAANIAQLVDCAKQLLAGGKEIYNSVHEARDEHQALKAIIEDIKNYEGYRSPTSSHFSADEAAFRKLATEYEPVAERLLDNYSEGSVSALRDTRLQSPKELVQVFLRVNIADVFEDAQFIVRYCARTLSEVVHCPDACWRDSNVAMSKSHCVSDTIVEFRPIL